MSAAFELRHVVRSFEKRQTLFSAGERERFEAVRGVSLSAGRGEVCGLIGESGCGKTTIANLLLMLLRPDSGEVWIGGRNVTGLRRHRDTAPVRRGVQAVFQGSGSSLNPRMTLEEIVTEPLRNYGLPWKGEAERLLADVGLAPEWKGRHPAQLSGGQRQRVSIARAMALAPELLVLDEPTSNLDVVTARSILDLLTAMAGERGATLLLITHDIALARRYCDSIRVMKEGRIVESLTGIGEAAHPYTIELLKASENHHLGGTKA